MAYVSTTEEVENINAAMALPADGMLHLKDGRIIKLTLWQPSVPLEGVVSVLCEGKICIAEDG